MTHRHPFVPRIQPGEAPLSVLRRAALGNGYTSTISFVRDLEPSVDDAVTALGTIARHPALFVEICVRTGIGRDEAARCAYRRSGGAREDDLIWHNLHVGVGDLQFRHSKLCLSCYLEEGFARAEWDHIAAHACARHRVLLGTACPVCSAPWSPAGDPLGCGCAPSRMVSRQSTCTTEEATLMAHLITHADQAGLDLMTALHRTVIGWRDLGVVVSHRMVVAILTRLFAGAGFAAGYLDQPDRGVALHPRIALAPLLASASDRARQHAQNLLAVGMPAIRACISADLTWPAALAMAGLGIGRMAFGTLVRDGHLRITDDNRVPVVQVNALLNRVADQLPSHPHHPLQALREGPIGTSLAGALAGQPAVAKRSNEPGSESPSGPAAYTISTAARHLGTNSESLRGLIHTGLLPANQGASGSAVAWVITAEQLFAFEREFVFGSALAASIGASATTFSSRLRSHGVRPVSGPGIDSGVTFVFRRCDLEGIDLVEVATTPYRSPAGRKRLADRPSAESILSTPDCAKALGIPVRLVRSVVHEGWLSPRDPDARYLTFNADVVYTLADRIHGHYLTAATVARSLGQSDREFRATWLDTGHVRAQRFAGSVILTVADARTIESLWGTSGTSSAIGRAIGRERWLCANLRKLDLLTPHLTLGSGAGKVHLYRRDDPAFAAFRLLQT